MEIFDLFQSGGLEALLVGASPVVIFFLIVAGTFVSEDATCVAAGVLAGQSRISFSVALSACFVGIFVGDVMLYGIGRIFGRRILNIGFVSKLVSNNSLDSASRWLDERGAAAIFLSRFVTGTRLPTYLAAGFLRTNFWKFTFYFLIASAIWTPLLVGSTTFASNWLSTYVVLEVVLILIALKVAMNLFSWKKRRMFVGRLKRIVKWEFWPLKVFYFPVVLYVLFLAMKHRSLTVFTCANPAIPASGFVGESKNEIYAGLQTSAAAPRFLLQHLLLSADLSADELLDRARSFIAENDLNFPLVLKPDAGERGKGVTIIRDFAELRARIDSTGHDLILQEFADGVEASVFYFRYPDRQRGEIFSITEKRFPKLLGNGVSSLEELILSDERAVCLAGKYFEQNSERLDAVPASNEEVQIIDIGTHSRGAVFLDGSWLRTPELETAIDGICRDYDGFHFGRFDLRARSFEELGKGNFKIIELNGVTSESTNIYDPRYSLLEAYRALFRQWRIAFEIGAANCADGRRPTSAAALARLFLNSNAAR